MNHSPPDYRLMARELADASTPAERARLMEWIAADPENRRTWNLLRDAWQISENPHTTTRYDADADWPRVLARIEDEARTPAPEPAIEPKAARPAGTSRPGMRRAMLRAAAVAALVLLPALGWLIGRDALRPGEPAIAEVVVPRGETREVLLPDGSRVRLAAASTLRYPAGLRGVEREVELDGMAHFEVAPDPDRPFVVRARGWATTRVLGTSFVVRAYPEHSDVEVAVAEGRVALGTAAAPGRTVVLDSGQVGTAEESGEVALAEGGSVEPYLAFARGVLVLEDRPLAEALAELERWYDAELKVEDPRLARRLIATTAGNVPLADVLAGIMLALDARYEQRGDTVVFVP